MILPDVNILVHAFRSDTSDHETCRAWLDSVLEGDARFGMVLQVLSGVVRITTHPKVFVQPSSLGEVLRFCDALLAQPHCVIIQPGEQHWDIFNASRPMLTPAETWCRTPGAQLWLLNPAPNGSLWIVITPGSRG